MIQALTKSLAPYVPARRSTMSRTRSGRARKKKEPAVPDIRIHRNSQAWTKAAAEFVQEVGKEAVRANGGFLIALSGGTTPETLYRALASPAFAERMIGSEPPFSSAKSARRPI